MIQRLTKWNTEDQEEIKSFEQFNKKPNDIALGDLTLHALHVVNGTYCESFKIQGQPSYAKQCEVLSQYEKQLELQKNKKELEDIKQLGRTKEITAK